MRSDEVRGLGSFGRPQVEAVTRDEQEPVPVLHVGEVHADLRLHITEETLTDLGSQVASMIAQATREGFDAGLAAALGDDEQPAGAPLLTEDMLRRARGD
jgi:hypothetical protein